MGNCTDSEAEHSFHSAARGHPGLENSGTSTGSTKHYVKRLGYWTTFRISMFTSKRTLGKSQNVVGATYRSTSPWSHFTYRKLRHREGEWLAHITQPVNAEPHSIWGSFQHPSILKLEDLLAKTDSRVFHTSAQSIFSSAQLLLNGLHFWSPAYLFTVHIDPQQLQTMSPLLCTWRAST